jgi:hypothetical protein
VFEEVIKVGLEVFARVRACGAMSSGVEQADQEAEEERKPSDSELD